MSEPRLPPQGRTASLAVDKRARMEKLEAPYLRAQEYIRSDQFAEDMTIALGKIRGLVRGEIGTADRALLLVGRVQQILADTYEFENVILEYEGLKKSLAEMYPGDSNERTSP